MDQPNRTTVIMADDNMMRSNNKETINRELLNNETYDYKDFQSRYTPTRQVVDAFLLPGIVLSVYKHTFFFLQHLHFKGSLYAKVIQSA